MQETISEYEDKKYSILYFLNTRLSSDQRGQALQKLPKILDISPRQMKRYIHAKKSSDTEAKPSYLQKIASYFETVTGQQVTVNDLLT